MLRLSFGSVTVTGFPQWAQAKRRMTFPPGGPARSSPVSLWCAFFRHRAEQYRWVYRSARKRRPHTGHTASRFMARPRSLGHAKKTAQKKLSFLYAKSAPKRARYDLLHAEEDIVYYRYTPPVNIFIRRIGSALFTQRVSKLTMSPPFFTTNVNGLVKNQCYYFTDFPRAAQRARPVSRAAVPISARGVSGSIIPRSAPPVPLEIRFL